MSNLALVERFYSVQGEGGNAGRAALFIRFAGCNLDCVFSDGSICDTPWRKAKLKVEMGELLEWCESWRAGSAVLPMVVITGGEPTMAPAFNHLVAELKGQGYYVAVETNGTIWRTNLEVCDWVTVSPKDWDVEHPTATTGPSLNPSVQDLPPHEWRYVIGEFTPAPPYRPGGSHYVSPATLADGKGLENILGFPGFVPGAVDRCLEIVANDPRWRVSLQTHKLLGVR